MPISNQYVYVFGRVEAYFAQKSEFTLIIAFLENTRTLSEAVVGDVLFASAAYSPEELGEALVFYREKDNDLLRPFRVYQTFDHLENEAEEVKNAHKGFDDVEARFSAAIAQVTTFTEQTKQIPAENDLNFVQKGDGHSQAVTNAIDLSTNLEQLSVGRAKVTEMLTDVSTRFESRACQRSVEAKVGRTLNNARCTHGLMLGPPRVFQQACYQHHGTQFRYTLN